MYPRTNYEMTEAQHQTLLDACKPVACMMIGGSTGPNPQENANRAWASLGSEMGFDYMTVRPISGQGSRFFSAIPSENETQKTERLAKEAEDKRLSEISELERDIFARQQRLDELYAQ